MKLQRYDWSEYYKAARTFIVESSDGDWCASDDAARLEASYAELLEALNQCIDLMNNGGTWTLDQQAQARAAIVKAEGKEEQP